MRITDYSKIAEKYDKNDYRQKVEPDIYLKEYIEHNKKSKFEVLDLACGTGIYIHKQMEFFKGEDITWYGLDASQDMLDKAREKTRGVFFEKGIAEELPYESSKFDFIVSNYAFQHFTGKVKALDEVYRVLKTNGVFQMHNIAIHQMRGWWIYKYFPSAYYEDLKRFWEKDLIFYELSTRGFEVELNIKYQMQHLKVDNLLEYTKNRDISVLTLIDENEYLKGLELLKSEVSSDPNKMIVTDIAEMYCLARKS